MERSDLGRGEFDTSIGALARRLAAAPAASSVLYYCGYALEFNGRSFLLPASASIARDYDVLTQGIIAKSLVDSLIRGNESRGLVLLDVFRTPAASSAALGGVAEQIRPSNFAVIGASNDGASEGPTAASLALRDQAAEGETSLDLFAAGIHRRLAKAAAVTAHFIPAEVAARPEAPPSPAPAASTAIAVPPPPSQPPPEPAILVSPAAPPSRAAMADEDQMSDQDRRRVQALLATMGYYSGRIDGTFGPETRAAIRRYQFEIKADLTGRLNAEQATRLVNSAR